MCGVVGLVGQKPVSFDLYDAISMLQHRGQDAAGIVTCEGDRLTLRKENGLVRDVFNQSHLEFLAAIWALHMCDIRRPGPRVLLRRNRCT